MTWPRNIPHLRSAKFAPFALMSLFLLTNFTGIFFIPVLAPSANATTQVEDAIPADIPTSGDPDVDRIIFRTSVRHGIDPRFIHAVIWQESKYQPRAISRAGAQGLMQLMPATARRFGCSNPNDMATNVEAGTKYLRWLLKRFNGDVTLALAGYNAGEGAVDKYHGVPPYNETQNYVRKIVANYGKTILPVITTEAANRAVGRVSSETQGQTSSAGSIE